MVLKSYCTEKDIKFPDETIEKQSLDNLLQKFYPATRKTNGQLYSKKSMLSIRYGLQKHFEKLLSIDIVNDPVFKVSNRVFGAMLVKLKDQGLARVQYKDPLTKQDLVKLYNSFDLDTPEGLQDKVFIDFMMYFCNRGRENLCEIKKTDFRVNEAEEFIELRDMMTKNHKGDMYDSTSQGGRIYRTGTIMCAYSSFRKYLSVLNNDCDLFFQRPKSKLQENPSTWFDAIAVGKNTLGDKMKTLSLKKQLSKVYTNHCLRATSITFLDSFEARHVMAVSGHKSESSIRSYARTSGDQKHKMALTLAEALSGSGQPVKSQDVGGGIIQDHKDENIENQETVSLHEGIVPELGQSRFNSVAATQVQL